MLISYTILPVFILIHSVISVDLYKSKRVIRDLEEIQTPYNSNHPPLQESYIPVSVIYDDEDDIRIISKSTKEDTQSTAGSKIILPSSIRKSEKPVLLTLKTQFGNDSPASEKYDTIPVAIVTDDIEEEITKHDEKSISIVADQEKVIESDKPTDVKQINKDLNVKISQDVETEVTTSRSDTNINVAVRNDRKLHARRLNRVITTKVDENTTTPNEKTDKTPAEVNLEKITENPKNNNRPTKVSEFQKRTQQRDPIVPIVDSENYVYAYNGDYHYSYQGGDGTKAFERGELKTSDEGSSGTGVVGGFSYTDNDGNDFSLSYTADENGYRPIGAHLPTPPPIPPAIQRALDILATKTTPEPVTEKVNKSN